MHLPPRVFAILALVPLCTLAQPAPDTAAETLAAMLGTSRPLLIFSPDNPGKDSPGEFTEKQRDLLADHQRELKERNVAVIWVPSLNDSPPASIEKWRGLRDTFHVDARRFTVILVGKDGGEKFRSNSPVTIEKLDALIDAMPMRQQEMRDGRHTK